MKKQSAIIFVVGVLVLLLMGSIICIKNALSSRDPSPTIINDNSLQVVSQVKLHTWTEKGVIVVMDDSSSFAQLQVFVPREYIDNQYLVGDYLNIYHNGIIKDGLVAEFQKIYKIEPYQINSEVHNNEWDINSGVDISNNLFINLLWPAVQQNYAGVENAISPVSILAISHSRNPIYAILCAVNNGGRNNFFVYYVQVTNGKAEVLLSESILVGLDRLT